MATPVNDIPQNLDAERATLGAILIDPEAIWTVQPIVQEKDFYLQKHRWIYAAFCSISERGEALDYMTVLTELEHRAQLEAVGGAAYVTSLINTVPSAVGALTYAGLVVEAARRREGLDLVSELARRFYDERADVDDTLTYAVTHLQEQGRGGDLVAAREVVERLNAEFNDHLEHPLEVGQVRGLDTGWLDINNALGGWKPGLYIVLGEPHVGKTWFALQAAAKVAARGKRVLFFSLEMRAEQLVRRLCLAYSKITQRDYDRGALRVEQIAAFQEAEAKIHDWNLDIADGMEHAGKIFATIHREMRGATPPALVVIDYLGLMITDYRAENTNWELIALTRGLKNLSRQLQVPILAPHQISDKQLEARADKRPRKSDGYGSGGPSQDGDVILGLYRPFLHDPTAERGAFEVAILKDRLGGGGQTNVSLLFQGTGALMDAYKAGGKQ